jgi:hypothetical protein
MADVTAKVCTGCHRILPLEAFRKASKGKYGRDAKCKDCRNSYMKEYRKNPEIIERERVYHAERYKDPEYRLRLYHNAQKPERKAQKAKYKAGYDARNKEAKAAYMREYCKDERVRQRRLEASRRYDERHPEERATRRKTEEYRKWMRRWDSARRKQPKWRVCHCMSSRMNKALERGKEGRSWREFVTYSLEELMKHLEKQFKSGMTWDNHGTYWHIDHITPIAAFNFTTPYDFDFKRCWALKNLQPLEIEKNLSKGKKITKPFQPALSLAVEVHHR